MASLASLIVRIGASTADLNKGLNQAERDVQRVGKKMERVGSSLAKGLTLPIVAAGAAAAAAAIHLGGFADKLLDLADQTGLSTDTLQEFRHVAIAAGVESDTLATAAIKLTTALSSGDDQTKQLTNGLARLGLKATDLTGALVSMDVLLPNIITKLQGVQDVTTRNTIAADIFGRSWVELGPIMGLGADEMERARQVARDLGLVMSKESLEAANAFRIKVDTLKASMGGITREIGMMVMPVMEKFAGFLQNSVVPAIRATVKWFSDLSPEVKITIGVVAGLAAALAPLVISLAAVMHFLPLLKAAFFALTGPVGLSILAIGALTAAGIQMAKHWDAVELQFTLAWAAMKDVVFNAVDKILGVLDKLYFFSPAHRAQIQGLRKELNRFADESLAKSGRAIAALEGKLQDAADAAAWATLQNKKLVDGLTGGGSGGAPPIISETGKKIAQQMKEMFDRIADETGRVIRQFAPNELAKILNVEKGLFGGGSILSPKALMEEAARIQAGREGNRRMSGLEAAAQSQALTGSTGNPKLDAMLGKLYAKIDKQNGAAGGDSMGTKVSQVLQAGGGGSEIGQMVQAVASFGPLAALLPVINGALEKLGPVFSAMIEPLKAIGRVIGDTLAPQLRLVGQILEVSLYPVLKLLSAVSRVVTVALSYFAEGLGHVIRFIGKLIDSLPFVSAQGIIRMGQEMIDAARAARLNTDATEDATDAVNKFASSLSNIPRVLNINALRHMITGGPSGGPNPGSPTGGTPGGGGGLGPKRPVQFSYGDTNVYITVPGAGDPVAVAEAVGRVIQRSRDRGGVSRLSVALAT